MKTNKSLKVRIALLIAVVAMALNACNVKDECQSNMCGLGSPSAAWQALDTNGDNLFSNGQ